MKLYEKLINREANLAVVGLGYVGLPIAVAFAEKVNTMGFDINEEKIADYQNGIDPTQEVGDEKIKNTKLRFTTTEADLQQASFIIVQCRRLLMATKRLT